jgi:hypothetical protein
MMFSQRRRRHDWFLRLLLIVIGTFSSVVCLQHKAPTTLINEAELKKAIYSGRVYQQANFLTEEQVQTVLAEVEEMESNGGFERSGLSNTLQKNQTFGYNDRSICVVPWFIRALEQKDNREIPSRIQQLQVELSKALNRPTMMDTSLSHECYYSKSEVGSKLPRHMDERHEELKGAKGWLRTSRRSLSWLVYLSDVDWTLEENGGALRSWPQAKYEQYDSTHEGNLQVGWLQGSHSTPVYLDSWLPVKGVVQEGTIPEPHCILYVLEKGERKFITRPWLNDSLQGMTAGDFLKAWKQQDMASDQCSLFVSSDAAKEFSLLEDRQSWDEGKEPSGTVPLDIVPLRGSLVVFDSVTLPHQVEVIKAGTRIALAGWFHEETQPFPTHFYS